MNKLYKNIIFNPSKLITLLVCSICAPITVNAACGDSAWDAFEIGAGQCAIAYEFTNISCSSPTQLWTHSNDGNSQSLGLKCAKALKTAGAEYGFMTLSTEVVTASIGTTGAGDHAHTVSGQSTYSSGPHWHWNGANNVQTSVAGDHTHSVNSVNTTTTGYHAHTVSTVNDVRSVAICYRCTNANISLISGSSENTYFGIIPKGYKYNAGQWIASAPSCNTGQIIYPGTSTCVDASLAYGAQGCTDWSVAPATGNKYCNPGLTCKEQTPGVNVCMNVITTVDGNCGPNDICGDSLLCKNNKCTDVARNAICITDTDCATGEICVSGSSCVAAQCHNL